MVSYRRLGAPLPTLLIQNNPRITAWKIPKSPEKWEVWAWWVDTWSPGWREIGRRGTARKERHREGKWDTGREEIQSKGLSNRESEGGRRRAQREVGAWRNMGREEGRENEKRNKRGRQRKLTIISLLFPYKYFVGYKLGHYKKSYSPKTCCSVSS